MKHTKSILLTGALLLAASSLSFAQGTAPAAPATATPPPAAEGGKPAPRPEGRRHGPPSPLFALFDTNKDGVISAEEIAAAPAVLKALDKNGDGKLTPDEVRPPRPEGRRQGGPGRRGPGGPDGPGRGDHGDMPPPPPGQGPDNSAGDVTPPPAPEAPAK